LTDIVVPPVDGTEKLPDLPMEHVVRSRPPWRRGEDLTECGKAISAVHVAISRDAFIGKVKRQGQQRSALTTCMTCWNTARNHPSWQENPVASLVREAMRVRWQMPGRDGADLTFLDELRAIEALIAAHPDEWDELLTGLGQTTRLDERRFRRPRRHG
jgi:hypothetical protein